MVVLITGVTGYIGSHLTRHLLAEGHRVIGFESYPTWSRITDIADRISLIQGDICDPEVLMETIQNGGVTHIVHLAAFMPAAKIADAPTKALRINGLGTNNVFEAARLSGVQRVVYASSNAVSPLGPEENDPVSPSTMYGQLKHLNEVMGRHYHQHFGLDNIGLRFVLPYGTGRLLAGEFQRQYGSGAVFDVLEALILGSQLKITLDPQTDYDWIHIEDNSRLITLALQAPSPQRRVYNIPGPRKSVKDAVDIIEKLVPGAKGDFEDMESREAVVRTAELHFSVDPEIVKQELGYSPHYSWEEGWKKYVDDLRSHPELTTKRAEKA